MVIEWMIVPLAVTPSLAYMAEVTSIDGADAYGVGYGVYNTAWAHRAARRTGARRVRFERVGLAACCSAWAAAAILLTLLLGGVQSESSPCDSTAVARALSPALHGGRNESKRAYLTLGPDDSGRRLSSHSLNADVRADEKTRVEFGGPLGGVVNLFGGKAAREGVTSTVAVKGDRKATLSDTTGRSSICAKKRSTTST